MTKTVSNQWENVYNKVIVKAWKDDSFKELLLKKPDEALEEFGFVAPKNIVIQFTEVYNGDACIFSKNSLTLLDAEQERKVDINVPIPPKPQEFATKLNNTNIPESHNFRVVGCCCLCL